MRDEFTNIEKLQHFNCVSCNDKITTAEHRIFSREKCTFFIFINFRNMRLDNMHFQKNTKSNKNLLPLYTRD